MQSIRKSRLTFTLKLFTLKLYLHILVFHLMVHQTSLILIIKKINVQANSNEMRTACFCTM